MIAAVMSNGKAIKYIKNPHPDLQLIAVNKDPINIKYIENPDEKLQLAAIKKDTNAFYHINHPSDSAVVLGWQLGLPIFDRFRSKDKEFFESHKATFVKKCYYTLKIQTITVPIICTNL